MPGHFNNQARPVSRLRWAGVLAFLAGVGTLFAGAAIKASGTLLLALMYAGLSFATVAGFYPDITDGCKRAATF
ncbi:hypothetical protein Xcom_21450 (plasmid) [Xanthomonas axonopodis pv. commiphoreae]|nr:hypothetical protein Xcom_21450 [Xanthomonas axonopodis pv. commiphoreae]